MAQHDYIILNQTFPNTRADINSVLSAISTNNSGTSAPSTQYAGQFWIDTTSSTWTLYIHDGADDIQFATIDTSANTVNFTDSALDVVTDTSPQLGGNLDLNSNDITGTGNINITGTGTFSGDLTVDTSTLYVDSSNNKVGIGETAPLGKLHVKSADSGVTPDASADELFIENSDTGGMTIGSGTSGVGTIYFGDSGDNNAGRLNYYHSDDSMRMFTAGAESMRIDSSGNVLVGKTSADANTAGFEIVPAGRIGVTRDGNITAILNRLSSDGEIVRIQKDGTVVGSIGNSTTNLYLDSGAGAGLFIGGDSLAPRTSGSLSDDSIKLGTSSYRYKELFLSGGVYLGGTGTANKLDDYEEGTWTPTYSSGLSSITYTAQDGQYTKVGRMVSFAFRLENSAGTATASQLKISGLPFTTNSSQPGSGAHWSYQPAGITGDQTISPILFIPLNSNLIAFYNANGDGIGGNDLVSTTNDIYIRGVYFTN